MGGRPEGTKPNIIDGVKCPYCEWTNSVKKNQAGMIKCNACQSPFRITRLKLAS